jgi:serine phosphatase RsbU (regulator of sigma subunit)
LVIYFISGILLLVVGFAIFAYRSYLQKQIANKQLDEKNKKIESAYAVIEDKNREITDSINYARRIQSAMLPTKELIQKAFPQSFVLFKPKDIVSGDFYFMSQQNGTVFLAAADCTGHGVPGAFMSMIGSEKLNDAVGQSNNTADILKLLNKGIKTSLRQSNELDSTRDGMDIALVAIASMPSKGGFKESLSNKDINLVSNPPLEGREAATMQFSGANRPLWIVRKGKTEIEEVKPTKLAIGGFTNDNDDFEAHNIMLNSGDTIYLFSDGYADQFGGAMGKKLTTKKYRELILSLSNKSMPQQEKELNTFIEEWKGNKEQLDDILIIGVRV